MMPMFRRSLPLLLLAMPAAAQAPEKAADLADAMEMDNALQYLRTALGEMRANRLGQAIELLERAESRLLTRATGNMGRPVQGGPVADIATARRALGQRDVASAQALTQKALEALQRRRQERVPGK